MRAGFASIYIHTSHLSKHTGITLRDVPNREYTLRLFVEDVERDLRKNYGHTWTPAQRQYVPYFPDGYTHSLACGREIYPTSQIRAEARMKSGHSFWAKYREASEVIELHGLFRDYWSSHYYDFTVLSQSLSPTGRADLIVKHRGRCHWKA